VIGVETGYMVNAQSPSIPLAVEFLALVNSPENAQKLIDEAEIQPLAHSTTTAAVDARSTRLQELLNNAPAIVLPPDTGYDLKMANALFSAEAAVLGNQQSPADALKSIDSQLGR
jgi:raffinose/stachyose/melibiose transport system substrate-binding protein